jgi:hypothetical protein
MRNLISNSVTIIFEAIRKPLIKQIILTRRICPELAYLKCHSNGSEDPSVIGVCHPTEKVCRRHTKKEVCNMN